MQGPAAAEESLYEKYWGIYLFIQAVTPCTTRAITHQEAVSVRRRGSPSITFEQV